jgi:hypothetical protein
MTSAWDAVHGLDRVAFLPMAPDPSWVLPPGASDPRSEMGPFDFVNLLHRHAHDNQEIIGPRAIEGRRLLWDMQGMHHRARPSWLTFSPAEMDLRQWQDHFEQQCGVDSIEDGGRFVTLAHNGHWGYMEACRILHHLTKNIEVTLNPNLYTSKCCEEATKAIAQERAIPYTDPRGRFVPEGTRGRSASSSAGPRSSCGGASSSRGYEDGKGKGGKGNYYQDPCRNCGRWGHATSACWGVKGQGKGKGTWY